MCVARRSELQHPAFGRVGLCWVARESMSGLWVQSNAVQKRGPLRHWTDACQRLALEFEEDAMIRMLIRLGVFLASAALGLLVASWVIDGVTVTASGFLLVVVVYAVIQSVISPFLTKMAMLHASAFLGGVGLVAALVALIAASLIGNSLTISGGVGTWIAATVVVWLVTAVGTLLLPFALAKAGVQAVRQRRSS